MAATASSRSGEDLGYNRGDHRIEREARYSAEPNGLAPLADWKLVERDGPMSGDVNLRPLGIESEMLHLVDKVWRALTEAR
jgi:hypothetical protein